MGKYESGILTFFFIVDSVLDVYPNYFTFCLFLKSMCNQFNAADLNIQVYVGKLPETGCEEEDIKEHFAQVSSFD